MKALKIIAAPIGIALLLYVLAVFVSMETDPREWGTWGRALLAWVWACCTFGVVGLIASGEAK